MAKSGLHGHDQRMMKLLIVDHSKLIRTSLLGLLEYIPGIDTINTADTLAQTLESVQHTAPTLVILASHLPDGNAIQIIHTLKQLVPGVLIAVFTNDAHDFNRRKCLAVGADWFFDKSIEFGELLAVVRTHAAPI